MRKYGASGKKVCRVVIQHSLSNNYLVQPVLILGTKFRCTIDDQFASDYNMSVNCMLATQSVDSLVTKLLDRSASDKIDLLTLTKSVDLLETQMSRPARNYYKSVDLLVSKSVDLLVAKSASRTATIKVNRLGCNELS